MQRLWLNVLLFWILNLLVIGHAAEPEVRLSIPRGYHDRPFELRMEADGSQIRFTTDGTEPTLANGSDYTKPIPINNSTIIKTAGFKGEKRSTPVATFSYIFFEQVTHQANDPPGLPEGPRAWGRTPSAYGMDPRVVNDPLYRDEMKQALQSLPILSVVCKKADLFGSREGLYLHPEQRGENWERPCSAEFIPGDGTPGFQMDCGIKIQGNSNRMPAKSPKHSFRLMFRKKYGSGKLHYPIFPDSPVEKFDTLVLRADFNNSWVHWEERNRTRAQRTRDAWMKDSHRAMGWLAGHNRYVHLYLNGLYWGVYDVAERLDASFAAAYMGGAKEDYDVINEFEVKDGTMEAFAALQSFTGLESLTAYKKIQNQLDLIQFIDYMLLNYYAGNVDVGEHKNWYALRRRTPPGRFQFMVWDPEQILCNPRDDTVNNHYVEPFRLVEELKRNPEYRLAFADRVQKHFFNGGALTPQASVERWMKRANEIRSAIVAESARWGYYRAKAPFTRDKDWVPEQERLLKTVFPKRTAVVLEQLKTAGLYPNVAAPAFTQIKDPEGFTVSIKAPDGGTIYYTMDEFDPRVPYTGAVSLHSQSYSNALKITGAAQIKARVLKQETWSALVEVTFASRDDVATPR